MSSLPIGQRAVKMRTEAGIMKLCQIEIFLALVLVVCVLVIEQSNYG
jgi:hypothetical protein